HFFTQIPQPMHRNSDMNAILSVDLTSIQSLPRKLVGMSTSAIQYAQHDADPFLQQDMTIHEKEKIITIRRRCGGTDLLAFLHSWAHRFGLQRLESTMAIRVILSAIA
ncbi:hypothetical protein BS17DRAFT_699780, partial [Gyrodon lividus]